MSNDIWTWLPIIIGSTLSEHLFRFMVIILLIAIGNQLLTGVVCK